MSATLDRNKFYDTGCIDITFKYDAGPLTLLIYLTYNTQHEITAITRIKLSHLYFLTNVANLQNKMDSLRNISSHFAHFILRNKKRTIYIDRAIMIETRNIFNKKTNIHSLRIKFVKAPSIFFGKTFTIRDIIDQQSILKYSVNSAVSKSCNKVFSQAVLSIIFEQYLSKFFWCRPEPFMYHSLQLNINDISISKQYETLDTGLLGMKHRICMDQEISELLHGGYHDNLIKEVSYVTYKNLNQINTCNINGIGVEVKITEDIDPKTYPELHRMLNYYNLFSPDFSAIWSCNNPSMFYDLKNLLRGIQMFGMNKVDEIEICAKLLIDKNIAINDVAMLWIKWKSINDSNDSDDTDDCEDEIVPLSLVGYRYLMFPNIYRFSVSLKFMSVNGILDMINNGDDHFGEPIVALQKSTNLTDDEMKAIKILGIYNDEYNTKIIRHLQHEENMQFVRISQRKRKYQNKNKSKRYRKCNKMMHNNKYPNKCKKYSYHRW
eukprot:128745_1